MSQKEVELTSLGQLKELMHKAESRTEVNVYNAACCLAIDNERINQKLDRILELLTLELIGQDS